MNTLKKLNSVGTLQTVPFKKIKDLEIDYEYKVGEIKHLETKFGNKIIALLIDSEYNEFQIFLPDRFNKNMTNKDIKELNQMPDLKLVYKGTKPCGKGNEAFIIEFI